MARYAVLLRGINLGPNRRISMAALRAALEGGGFRDVATYVQSGNVVLSSRAGADAVGKRVNDLVRQNFGFDVPVIVRSEQELAAVVSRNPLREIARDPARHLVTFFSSELPMDVAKRMRAAAGSHERFEVIGREVYSWHPAGVGRSPLWERLAGKLPGLEGTTRNWTTVRALLAMAGEGAAR